MIMRTAIFEQVNDIYVTIFEKHVGLVNLLKRYGFEKHGTKGKPENPESVYVKSIPSKSEDLCKCFPFIHTSGKINTCCPYIPNITHLYSLILF